MFVQAPLEVRAGHIAERHNVSLEKAKELAVKTDKRRSNYYNYYTGQKWGRLENFDLTVDSSKLGIDGTAEFIAQFVGDYRRASEKDKYKGL